jgi:hypothetical protein
MLRVTVEIWPGGIAELRRTLGLMNIANTSNLADVSSYEVYASEGDNRLAGTKARNCKTVIERHDRRQSVWALIEVACAGLKDADFVEM